MAEDYGSPYYHIHRADLHRLLFDLVADTNNVVVRLNSTVRHLDPKNERGRPSVTLATGEVVHGDLIIGADGVKSMIRQVRPAPTVSNPHFLAETSLSLLCASPRLSLGGKTQPLPQGMPHTVRLYPVPSLKKTLNCVHSLKRLK